MEVARGSNPIVAGERYRFPLFAAQAKGSKETLRALLSSAAPETRFRSASAASQADIDQAVIELLGHRHVWTTGHTPLMRAAAKAKVALFKCLLAQHGDDVSRQLFLNKPLPSNETETLRCTNDRSTLGHIAILDILLAADGVRTCETVYSTAARWAIENGFVSVIRVLLGRGYSCLDSPIIDRSLVLHMAVRSCCADMVRQVLHFQSGSINLLDRFSQTPLMYATKTGYAEMVEILLQVKGINVNMVDGLGRSALFYAAQVGAVSMVRALLSRADVNVNLSDRCVRTPLYMACNDSGVNEDGRRARGRVPVELDSATPTEADHIRFTDVVKLLLERADINVNRASQDGGAPILCAHERGAWSIVCLLLNRPEIDVDTAGMSVQVH